MKNSIICLLLIFIGIINLTAQVGINEDGSTPDASAILDIKSTDKGLLIPRMTTTQRNAIASPATGLLVYETTTQSFWFYNGSKWIQKLSTNQRTGTLADNDNDTKVIVHPTDDKIEFYGNNSIRYQLYQNATNIPILHYNSNATIFGQYAGKNHNQNRENDMFGYKAGFSVSSNNGSLHVGGNAGATVDADANVFVGYNSGNSVTNSRQTTIIGAEAGTTVSLQKSVAIGYQAGYNASGGQYFGYQTGTNLTTEGLYIDNSNTNKPLIAATTSDITFNGTLKMSGNLNLGTTTKSISVPGYTGAGGISVGTAGNIGIGTNTGNNDLNITGAVDVTGEMTINNGDSPLASNSELLILAGMVDDSGNLVTSSTTAPDFGNNQDIESVSKTSEGHYTITLSSGTFIKTPNIIITAHHNSSSVNRYAVINSADDDVIEIVIRNQNGSSRNGPFSFIIIGQQVYY